MSLTSTRHARPSFYVMLLAITMFSIYSFTGANSVEQQQKSREGEPGDVCYSSLLGICYINCAYEFFVCVNDDCGGDFSGEQCVFNEETGTWQGVAPEYGEYCICFNHCDIELKGACQADCREEFIDSCPTCDNKKGVYGNLEVRSVKQKDTPYSCQDLEIGECYVGCEYDWFDCVEEQCDGNHVLEWCVFDDDSHGWKGAEPQYDEYCDCANEACKLDRINCFLACDTDTEIRCPSCNDGDLDDDATDDDSAADDDDTGAAGDDDDDDSGKSACGG